MAEIRVAKPARRGRAWLWLIPLVLLLAAGAYFFRDRLGADQTATAADTTSAVSTGALDTTGATTTGTTTPAPGAPAVPADTAPGRPR